LEYEIAFYYPELLKCRKVLFLPQVRRV